jgi:hypothetical protein
MNVRQLLSPVMAACALSGASMSSHAAVLLNEGFNSLAALPGAGWVFKNNSQPLGATDWFQGNTAVFPAADGPADSYAAANFENAGSPAGRISNWMITPQIALDGTPTLDFALRLFGSDFLDTVEVYLSTAGSSSDVGTTSTSTGDFTLLQAFSNAGPDSGWINESITLAAFASGTMGRLAFRYFVDNTDVDGNYVGIDSVNVSTRDATVPEPTPAALLALALVGMAALRRRR